MSQRTLAPGPDEYLLLDTCTDAHAAGTLNGTTCDTGQVRTVVDTENKLSINGAVVCAGGKAVAEQGDPGYWITKADGSGWARTAGLHMRAKVKITDATQTVEVGWDTNTAGALAANCLRFTADTIKPYNAGVAGPVVGVPADGVEYDVDIVTRTNGAHYYIKGGAWTTWTLLWVSTT
jgi:hypothetical protein